MATQKKKQKKNNWLQLLFRKIKTKDLNMCEDKFEFDNPRRKP